MLVFGRVAIPLGGLLLLVGCTGQNVEGAWRGPFPLEGTDSCEMKLMSNQRFTISCIGSTVVGAGTYTWDRRRLVFSPTILTFGGHPSRNLTPIEFSVEGHGNAMTLGRQGETFEWRRKARGGP